MELRYYQKEAVQAMLEAQSNQVVVMPTGSGKTIVIAEFLKQYGGKVLVLSHVKEILAQNYESLVRHGINDIGLWSAGLGIKIIKHVTVAGIQSVYNKPELF